MSVHNLCFVLCASEVIMKKAISFKKKAAQFWHLLSVLVSSEEFERCLLFLGIEQGCGVREQLGVAVLSSCCLVQGRTVM